MNRLSPEGRTSVIRCLIEGCSIRSTVRMTGVAKKTVMRLLGEVGMACPQSTKIKVAHYPPSGRLAGD